MFLYNTLANGKPQPRSPHFRFCRKKGIKDLFQMFRPDSRSLIRHVYDDLAIIVFKRGADGNPLLPVGKRLTGVLNEIDHHLLQPLAVSPDWAAGLLDIGS